VVRPLMTLLVFVRFAPVSMKNVMSTQIAVLVYFVQLVSRMSSLGYVNEGVRDSGLVEVQVVASWYLGNKHY
jgi:hypothetical protein